MLKGIYSITLPLCAALMMTTSCYASDHVPVTGFARTFITGEPLIGGTVTVLETGQKVTTNQKGEFGPILYPANHPITLRFEKWGYKTTQSATVLVPPTGLTGKYDNITFQVPETVTYALLASVIGATIDDNNCHVVTTVTDYHKTMDDIPQGIEGAKLVLFPGRSELPFYFDIFKSGPLKGKTNPFTRGLTQTSEDGGAAYFNLPPRHKPYRLTAEKDGTVFSSVEFVCTKGAFINISPPRGPSAYAQ